MIMLFKNLNIAVIWKYLRYKNIDEMMFLLTKLPYSKIIWQIKSLNIYSVIVNVVSKKYHIYYLIIIPII